MSNKSSQGLLGGTVVVIIYGSARISDSRVN